MRLHGCHNQPRPAANSTVRMQDGWTEDGRRRMVDVPIMPSAAVCIYWREHLADPGCTDCQHKEH